jgi:hypothetical protein
MKATLKERLEAMRLELARQNEAWEQTKELLAGNQQPVEVPAEVLAEIDRVCDVAVRPTNVPSNLDNRAIRA